MDYFSRILISRCSRANLDTTKQYIMVKNVNEKLVEEKVGQFVKTYRMGSGDGMTLHWEFIKDGLTISVGDSMWGSINGSGLVGFRPVE